jgi:transposase-like protein
MNEIIQFEREAPSKYNRTTAEQRQDWARRFSESGLSLRQFSAQHGLNWYSLWRWVDRCRQVSKQGSVSEPKPETFEFTEIKLPARDELRWVAELSLPNGRVLRLSKEVPAPILEQLLRVC